MGLRAGVDTWEMRKISFPYQELNHDSSVSSPLPSDCTDCSTHLATGAVMSGRQGLVHVLTCVSLLKRVMYK